MEKTSEYLTKDYRRNVIQFIMKEWRLRTIADFPMITLCLSPGKDCVEITIDIRSTPLLRKKAFVESKDWVKFFEKAYVEVPFEQGMTPFIKNLPEKYKYAKKERIGPICLTECGVSKFQLLIDSYLHDSRKSLFGDIDRQLEKWELLDGMFEDDYSSSSSSDDDLANIFLGVTTKIGNIDAASLKAIHKAAGVCNGL